MKHLVLCLTAFLCLNPILQAQSKKELSQSLARDLESYRKFSLALNFDSSFQFMPPKTFEIVPFDSLKATMIQAMDNEYMTIQLTGFSFDTKRKPKIKKAGEFHWALVPYVGKMRMILKGEESFKKILIPVMKSQFGSENVQMEGDSAMQVTLKNKQLIAYKDPASPIWYMIEDKRLDKGGEGEADRQFLYSVLPEAVLKALEKH